jgi:hypothetical protein
VGIIGHGTTVSLGGDTIGQVTKFSISGGTRDEIDVSSANSTAKVKELLGGIVTPGKASITCRISDEGADFLESHFAAGTVEACLLTLSDGSTYTADGYMSSLDAVDGSYEGDITQSWSFTATKLWAYAAPA